MIKTVTTVDGVNTVSFDVFYKYFWIKNTGTTRVYASARPNVSADIDDTAVINSGECIRIDNIDNNSVYISGAGTVEIHAQDEPDCPFKVAPGNGGGSGENSFTTITINTSDWIENSDGGYMYTYTLENSMSYTNFIFDVVLSADQSTAKSQLEAWNCIIADGNIIQTISDGVTTAFTFYAFTNMPSVELTIGVQGVS